MSDRIRRPIRFPPFFIDRARGLDVHVFSLSSRQGFPNLLLRDLKLGETFYSKSNFFNSESSEIFIEGKESIKACVSWKSKRNFRKDLEREKIENYDTKSLRPPHPLRGRDARSRGAAHFTVKETHRSYPRIDRGRRALAFLHRIDTSKHIRTA